VINFFFDLPRLAVAHKQEVVILCSGVRILPQSSRAAAGNGGNFGVV
jgi:hypothetical protein